METHRHCRAALLAGAASCLLLLGGCVVAFGEGPHPKTYTTGQWMQQENQTDAEHRALASRVLAALHDDPLLSDADVSAQVSGHVVTLTGTLYDVPTLQHAIAVVQKVPGVQTVVSRIELDLVK
ncbi:MAG TPA: BON domain-containing protein [Gammaproteobacteria bacterium]|nr:BON domain-containing protein [Gammaproteobacteria bacterium]